MKKFGIFILMIFVSQLALADVSLQSVEADGLGRYFGIGIESGEDPASGDYVNIIFELDIKTGEMKEILRVKFDAYNGFGIDPLGSKAHLVHHKNDGNQELVIIDLKDASVTRTLLK